MWNGWFTQDGVRIEQPLLFPPDHPEFPDQLKGIKGILQEHNLWKHKLRGKCKKCEPDTTDFCGKRILEWQPDFKAQKSLVQEVIEKAGHLCIFLPIHCELNFIEFFWGKVKKYLRDHCDSTFETLKTNIPLALASVQLKTIKL